LKGQTEKAEMELTALVKSGLGKWEDSKPMGRGRPTRVFRVHPASPSPQFPILRGKTPNYGDGDAPNTEKITPSVERKAEAVSVELLAMPTGLLEL
jgi:hypothetical protein